MPIVPVIRNATPADVPAILAMVAELAEFEKLTHLLDMSEQRLHDDLFGARPVIYAVVAEVDSGVQAFALYFENYSTFLTRRGLYLEDLYVRPALRGQGLGKTLLKHLAKIAYERGYGRFDWSVLDWNANAISFYQSLGADVLPDWRICRVTGDALARLAS
ncbi:GNAT family N-acetyltransferase [Amantichitinum ursilacus]|uniref:Acetyltransferase (GNAT) family protein n=1 Tax=Amantichitinum ursilacus TaxID=857265 RepID=A0A0N0XIY1_9NEIS|nr:GNAT family N-acetyltransferase [Amantichitinum ursilacus]KPC52779.1 Acetyltransferase (GNAT) family protein [Amantichitinum ursilacus]